MVTRHTIKKIGLIDGANATINADTQTYHPGKILDAAATKVRYQNNPLEVRSVSGYDLKSLHAGKFNASIDIDCELRDCRQIFMLMGDVSNSGSDPNFIHTITTKTTRPGRPQTIYFESGGGQASDFAYKAKNCRIQRIEINAMVNQIVSVKYSFALGEIVSNTQLTTYPIAYDTEHDEPFVLDVNATETWNGNTISDLQAWQLVFERAVDPKYFHQSSGERYPYYNDAIPLKVFGSFIHLPDAENANDKTLFEDSLTGNLHDLVFELKKGDNNKINFNFADCILDGGEVQMPTVGGGSVGVMIYGFVCTTPTITEYSQVTNTHYT